MDLLIAPYTVTKEQADTAPATGTPGWATDGNAATNKPATQWPAYAFNGMQEELINVIVAAGLAPDRMDNTLLLKGVRALVAQKTGAATELASGVVKLSTVAQAQALTDDTTVLTPKKLAAAFQGSGQSFAGYQKLPGGLIMQWGITSNIAPGSNITVTFPIAFPNAAVNIWAVISYAGNSPTPAGIASQFISPTQGRIYNWSSGTTTGAAWLAFGY